MTERFFEQLLGTDFDRLHPVIQRHFFFRPDSGQRLSVHGVMSEVTHSGGIAWLYLPSAFVLGGPVPYRGRDVPITVHYQVEGRRLLWHREFDFGSRHWVFPSYMTIQGPGRGTEYLRGGIGVEFDISRSGGGLSFRSVGYHWNPCLPVLPFPIIHRAITADRPWP